MRVVLLYIAMGLFFALCLYVWLTGGFEGTIFDESP